MSAIDEILAAYREHGILEQALLDSHASGTDLTREVRRIDLELGSVFVVYVRDGGTPGMHGAPQDSDPALLGIVMDNRHKETYEVLKPFTVLRGYAADFETDRIPGVGGKGGGVQYILPPAWRRYVRKVQR